MLYRIDTFTIPEDARAEFKEASQHTIELLRTLPGFFRDQWFEKVSGPGSVDLITMVEWQDASSVEAAGRAVKALHAELGFDAAAFARDHGIVESKALYEERSQR